MRRSKRGGHWFLWLLLLFSFAALSLLKWGGYILVASDPLPSHADTAIVLQGSMAGEIARVAGAAQLLRENVVTQALLSVPKESYWGQSVPEAARAYIERNYGSAIGSRFVFCDTGPDVDSTQQEAEALRGCIEQHGWRRIVVVTSNYHTRRAGRIWRAALRSERTPIELSMYGVDDPEFEPRGWWRKRVWAKTWFYEMTKLFAEVASADPRDVGAAESYAVGLAHELSNDTSRGPARLPTHAARQPVILARVELEGLPAGR